MSQAFPMSVRATPLLPQNAEARQCLKDREPIKYHALNTAIQILTILTVISGREWFDRVILKGAQPANWMYAAGTLFGFLIIVFFAHHSS